MKVPMGLDEQIEFTLEQLRDLHHQATVERSHYYTGNTLRMAIALIEMMRTELNKAKP